MTLDGLLARLDLEQKVRLISGADFWSTPAESAVGLRRMVVSDGPSGDTHGVGGWRTEPGPFTVRAGGSSAALPLEAVTEAVTEAAAPG